MRPSNCSNCIVQGSCHTVCDKAKRKWLRENFLTIKRLNWFTKHHIRLRGGIIDRIAGNNDAWIRLFDDKKDIEGYILHTCLMRNIKK